MRRAGEADPQLRMQLFNMASQVYGKNPAELDRAIGPAAEARALFAKYLIDRKEVDAALQFWNGLSVAEKQANRTVGDEIIKTLMEAKRARQALGVWNELLSNDALHGEPGQLIDGGFERNSSSGGSNVFGWQIKSGQQAQASIDSASVHSGSHSLRLLFKARAKVDINVLQVVVVEPGTQYDLSCFVKTNKLESAGTPEVEIVDADGTVLARSQPAPALPNHPSLARPATDAVVVAGGVAVPLSEKATLYWVQ